MKDVDQLLVKQGDTLHRALQQLNEAGQGILLLVNEEAQLLRTVTDGDIRRLLLGGAKLSDTLAALPEQSPVVADDAVKEEWMLEIMNRHQVDHLPLLDKRGRPIRIVLRRDIDSRILLSTPHLGQYEMEYIEEAFRTNWVAPLGPNVDAFEAELAAYVNVGHAAALSSGTAALHLALRVLDVVPGDVIFCSTLTFVASANPILYQGASPVFIDSEPDTWNMSPRALQRALQDYDRQGKRPKAVIVVNLYGQSADFDPIGTLCEQYGVPIIEDAAESLGASYKGKASGTLGRLGVYSFNGNKIITTSGGGMLVSSDMSLVERARFLSTQARESADWYEHKEVGYNYRMSNVLAGIGRGQLKVLEERVAVRRQIFERYRNDLGDFEAIRWMPEATFGRSTRWLSVCTIDPEISTLGPVEIISSLAKLGIEARRVWKPMHVQPLFRGYDYYYHDLGKSFADEVFGSGICLPSGSNMTEEQQGRIIRGLRSIMQNGARRSTT